MTSTEDPLPPELSPRRQAAALGGVPPGSGRAPGSGRTAPGGGRPGPGGGRAIPGGRRRRRRWLRIVPAVLCVLVLLLAGAAVGTVLWADGKLHQVAAITDWSGRPADGPGTNWLLVGSDSRAGLTPAQQQELHVGADRGSNTDTLMVLHQGSNGPVLMSIPRDSYVPVPSWTDSRGTVHSGTKDKINAAYADGGPQLLVRTVEQDTGIRIDHYTEVGFTGLVSIVNALGGVPICLSAPVVDARSGADLRAGCQTLDGTQALQLVRTRYSLPDSDLSRIQNQQQFVRSLAKRAARPSTWLDPFRLYPFLSACLGALTVDRGTDLWTLVTFGRQLHQVSGSKGRSVTVPLADQDYTTPDGASAVLWSPSGSAALFAEVQHDRPVTAPVGPAGTSGS